MMKKRLVQVMTLLLAISMLAACTSPPAQQTTAAATTTARQTTAAATTAAQQAAAATTAAKTEAAKATAAAKGTPEDRPKLDSAFWEYGETFSFQPGNDDPYADYLMEKCNVTIVSRAISRSAYDDNIRLWAATDDLPNIFLWANAADLLSWHEQGLLRTVPTDLSAYPTLRKYLNEDAIPLYEQAKKDGVYLAIPRADFVVPKTYTQGIPYMRKTDYAAMGSPPLPDTVDDWFEFAMLAKKTFPDKAIISGGNQVITMFGEFNPDWGGSWVYYEEHDAWGPSIFNTYNRNKEVNRFWHAGLIDKDNWTTADFKDKFISGDSVIWVYTPFPGHLNNEVQPFWDKKNPGNPMGEALMQLKRPCDYEGNRYDVQMKYWSETYISAKTDEAQLAAILRMFEFFLSEEGFEFRRFGREGVDYKKEGGKVVITRAKNEAGLFKPMTEIYPSGYFMKVWATWDEEFPFVDPSIDPGILAFGNNYLKFKEETFKPIPAKFNLLITTINTEKKRELVINSGNEDVFRLAMAADYDAEWKAFVKKYESQGLWDMCKEITKIGRERGYVK